LVLQAYLSEISANDNAHRTKQCGNIFAKLNYGNIGRDPRALIMKT
jgi:hypothetical protein